MDRGRREQEGKGQLIKTKLDYEACLKLQLMQVIIILVCCAFKTRPICSICILYTKLNAFI